MDEAAAVADEEKARLERINARLLASWGKGGEEVGVVWEEEEEEGEKEGLVVGTGMESGCPETVTPARTSKLRWSYPVRVVPPTDSDPTDLFMDSNVERCAIEMFA